MNDPLDIIARSSTQEQEGAPFDALNPSGEQAPEGQIPRSMPATDLPSIYGNEFTKGLRRGLLGALGTTQAFGAQAVEPFSTELSNKLFDEAKKTLDFEEGLRPKVAKWADVRGPGGFLDYGLSKAGEAFPSTAISMGAAGVGGAAGLGLRALTGARVPLGFAAGAGSMFPQEAGEQAMSMHEDPAALRNTTPWGRLGLSAAKGGINAALEFAPEAVALRRAFGSPALRRGLVPSLGAVGAGMGEGIVGEAATEGLQEKSGEIFQGFANPMRDTSGDPEAIKEAMLGGAFGGGGLGAVGGGVQALRGNLMPDAEPAPVEEPGRIGRTVDRATQLAQRSADNVVRFVTDLTHSVDQRIQGTAKQSLEWGPAKQASLDSLQMHPEIRDRMEKQKMTIAQGRAAISALYSFREAPELLNTEAGQAAAQDLANQFGFSNGEEAIAALNQLIHTPGNMDVAHLGKSMAAQSRDASTFRGEEPVESDTFGEAPEEYEESPFGQEGEDLDEVLPRDSLGVNLDILSEAMQNRKHFFYSGIKPGANRTDMPLRFRSNSLTPQQFMKLLHVRDNEQGQAVNRRGFNDDEIAFHAKGDQLGDEAELPINPMSFAAAMSTAYGDQLGQLRGKQTGQSGSRKGDIFMTALATLINEGITVTDAKGDKHHVEVDVGPEMRINEPVLDKNGKLKLDKKGEKIIQQALNLPDNLQIWNFKDKGAYTIGHYKRGDPEDESPPTFPSSEQLALEREALQTMAPYEDFSDEDWKDAFEMEQKKLPFKSPESKALYKVSQNKGGLEDSIRRNARSTANDILKTINEDVKDTVYSMDDRHGNVENFIRDLQEYFGSDGAVVPASVKKLFKDNNVPLFSHETLSSDFLKNVKGMRPHDYYMRELENLRTKAEESRESGLQDQGTLQDMFGQRNDEESANVPGVGNTVWDKGAIPETHEKWKRLFNREVTPRAKQLAINSLKEHIHQLNTEGKWRIEGNNGHRYGFFKTPDEARAFIADIPSKGYKLSIDGELLTFKEIKEKWPHWKNQFKETKRTLEGDQVVEDGEEEVGKTVSVINPETSEIVVHDRKLIADVPVLSGIRTLRYLEQTLGNKSDLKVVDGTPITTEIEALPLELARLMTEQDKKGKSREDTPLVARPGTALARLMQEKNIETIGDVREVYAGKSVPLTPEMLDAMITQVVPEKEVRTGVKGKKTTIAIPKTYQGGSTVAGEKNLTAPTVLPGEGTKPEQPELTARYKGKSVRDKMRAAIAERFEQELDERGITDDFGSRVLPPKLLEEKAPTQKLEEIKVPERVLRQKQRTVITQQEGVGKAAFERGQRLAHPELEDTITRTRAPAKGEPKSRAFVAPTRKDALPEVDRGVTDDFGNRITPETDPHRDWKTEERLRQELGVGRTEAAGSRFYEESSTDLSKRELESLVTLSKTKGKAVARAEYERLKLLKNPNIEPFAHATRSAQASRAARKRPEMEEAEGELEQADVIAPLIRYHTERQKKDATKLKTKPVETTSGINFTTSTSKGWEKRTKTNADADVTIAIAADFTSGGERLTRREVLGQNRVYAPVNYRGEEKASDQQVDEVVKLINKVPMKRDITLNIAGNGLYTINVLEKGGTQAEADAYTEDLLRRVLKHKGLTKKIISVRTGGQTGFDEAGAKAGIAVGLPTEVHAPLNWAFRIPNPEGRGTKDITNDEAAFKARFEKSGVAQPVSPPVKAEHRRVKRTTKFISREDLKAHPEITFLFGDNLMQEGLGGQAEEMRGEPNAIGIPTKKNKGRLETSYFTDTELETNKKDIDKAFAKIPKNKHVVIPALGEGRAQLKERAPETYAYLQSKIEELIGEEPPAAPPTVIEQLNTPHDAPKKHFVPMNYEARKGELRDGLNEKYPNGASMLQLIKNGDRTGTTRTPQAGVRKGDTIHFFGNKQEYVVTGFERINLDTAEGRAKWEQREGWKTIYAQNLFQRQVRTGAIQMVFEPKKKAEAAPSEPARENIASPYNGRTPTPLGAALTNMTYGKYQVDNVPGLQKPDKNRDFKLSAEGWYKKNVTSGMSMEERAAVMQKVIEAKLRQRHDTEKFPDLMKAIDEAGGTDWIASTEHTVNGGRWEGKGLDSPFLKVLHDAYNAVKAEQAQPAPTAPAKPAVSRPPIFRTGRTHVSQIPTKIKPSEAKKELDAAKAEGEAARLKFLGIIRGRGGLSVAEAREIAGEKANKTGAQTFRRKGEALDLLIPELVNLKYMTQEDVDSDPQGGYWKVRDLIKAAMDKEVVAPLDETGEIKGRIAAAEAAWAEEDKPTDLKESQQAAETPGWNPPPGLQSEIFKKIQDFAEKMFGRKIKVEFGSKPGSTARGWYQTHRNLSGFKANEAKIKEIRQRRREALKMGNEGLAATLLAQEASLLKQNEVVGTIFLNPNLANREMFPTYYHEALHAAFDILLKPAEKAILGTAFSQGTVRRQLEKLFANDPAVLAQIKDAEEAAAYGFQIYAAAPHLLQLGPKVEGMFSKIAQWFRKMLGIMSPEEKAQIIMADMLSGRRAETGLSPLQRLLDKDMTFQQKVAKHATAVRELLEKLWDTVATPSYDRIIKMGIPSLTEFAKLGHTKTGEKGKLGMIQLMQNEISARFNWVNKITKKYSEEQIKEVADHRMNGTYPTDPELQKAYRDIDAFFNEFRKYAKDAGVNIGFIKNYWPMLWDAEKVMKGREEFLKMISQPKYAAELQGLMVTPTELWENISGYITRGDSFQGIMGPSGEPVNSYSSERSLSFLEPDDRKPFMHDSPVETMVNYTSHMVRQAEFVRAYGKKGATRDALLEEAVEKYGATPEQIVLANDYLDGLLGNKEVGMSRELKDLYGAAIVYQNYRLLPFNLFTSLVDPNGIAVRSGRIADAFETFVYAMKNLFRDLKKDRPDTAKDEWEQLSEDWGYIEDAGTMANLRHMLETTELRGLSKTMNDGLFKWNLLNGWTRSTKIMAVKAGSRFMARIAKGESKHDARHLEELGLTASDIFETQEGNIALRKDEFKAQGMSDKEAEKAERRMRDAMTKFVNQAILNPVAADLPNWGSNPYLAPIFHLKQFAFTFQTTILSRVIQEAMHGNMKPMMIAGIYIPGIIAADAMRGFVSNMGDQPPWQKNWGPVDYVKNGVARSGLMGSGQMFASMWDDVSHGGRGYESLVGPTAEQFMKGLKAASRGDTAMWNFTVKSMPLAPIYDQWLISSQPGPMGNHFGSTAASSTSGS